MLQVHSEHDSKFYQLMRQIENECNELDWTSSGGAAVGGSQAMPHNESNSDSGSTSGHRLGGGSAGTSRLLNPASPAPIATPALASTTKPEPPHPLPTAKEEMSTPMIDLSEDVDMEETTAESAPLQPAQASQPNSLKVRYPNNTVKAVKPNELTIVLSVYAEHQ